MFLRPELLILLFAIEPKNHEKKISNNNMYVHVLLKPFPSVIKKNPQVFPSYSTFFSLLRKQSEIVQKRKLHSRRKKNPMILNIVLRKKSGHSGSDVKYRELFFVPLSSSAKNTGYSGSTPHKQKKKKNKYINMD